MVRRALRVALFASFIVLLWTIARPRPAYAQSAAPLCDDRGATALAPPPALEASDVAIQRARASATCAAEGDLPLFATVGAAHHGVSPPGADALQALPTTSVVLARLAGVDLDDAFDTARPLDGVRSRLDRPPRA